VIAASPFYGEGYRKVWARLRVKGVRPAPRRVNDGGKSRHDGGAKSGHFGLRAGCCCW